MDVDLSVKDLDSVAAAGERIRLVFREMSTVEGSAVDTSHIEFELQLECIGCMLERLEP